MNLWQSYSADLKARGMANPYENEREFNRAYGIKEPDSFEPFIARKSTSHKKVSPTLENYEKPKYNPVKKQKAVKAPPKEKRPKMTPEQARLRRNELKRGRDRNKRQEMGIKPKKKLTEEEKKEYKREYMKKWRKLHPRASYESTMKWRMENPEENRKRRREEARRRRERKKNEKQFI